MSSDITNINLQNLLIAVQNYKWVYPKEIIRKLIYDPKTKLVTGFTVEETDLPHIVITKEQWADGDILDKKLMIVDGQIVEVPREVIKKVLPLVKGNRWFTTESNMLIIGNERGWDEPKYS